MVMHPLSSRLLSASGSNKISNTRTDTTHLHLRNCYILQTQHGQQRQRAPVAGATHPAATTHHHHPLELLQEQQAINSSTRRRQLQCGEEHQSISINTYSQRIICVGTLPSAITLPAHCHIDEISSKTPQNSTSMLFQQLTATAKQGRRIASLLEPFQIKPARSVQLSS
ncbi:hypothetical protein Nepgr_030867 [Nepenthes gracilis]|uniref:Uncharacterized protein n=1 Tax=Nepenthes gracilis TaxID=150966 RepID=A0AAD3Y6H3_NEPGR|nr:hypothetical protein Nepgr_030867 [Nepenthes gracilis]